MAALRRARRWKKALPLTEGVVLVPPSDWCLFFNSRLQVLQGDRQRLAPPAGDQGGGVRNQNHHPRISLGNVV